MLRRPHPILVVVAAAFLLGACDTTEPSRRSCEVTLGALGLTLDVGDSVSLSGTARCVDVAAPKLGFVSSAPDVVAVDANGRLVALKSGSAVITASVVGVAGTPATVPVSVNPCTAARLTGIHLFPSSATLVVGAQTQARAVLVGPTCAVAADSGVTFTSADTSVATVSAAGVITARAKPGYQTTITATAHGNPSLRATTTVTVVPPPFLATLQVSPTSVALAPLDTARLTATVTLPAGTPAGTTTAVTFRSADSCVARVSTDGLVVAGPSYGAATAITVSWVAAPGLAQQVPVKLTPTPPPGPSLTIRSITTGSPPQPADPNALRGVVTITAALARPVLPTGGRAELWLGSTLAATTTFAAPAPGEQFTALDLTVNTAKTDASGRPLFANGLRTFEVHVFSDGAPLVAGCPTLPAGLVGVVQQSVTLANP
jgi:hypothetical protein